MKMKMKMKMKDPDLAGRFIISKFLIVQGAAIIRVCVVLTNKYRVGVLHAVTSIHKKYYMAYLCVPFSILV